MKKLLFLGFFTVIAASLLSQSSIHSYTVKTIDGKDISLSEFKGKKIMVVNTASKCGLTPQYKDLEALYQKYKNNNFIIIGFPANNFKNQEPGTNDEIKDFCQVNYGVTFPMMAKISVKGDDMHDIYKWLTQKDLNGKIDSKVKWNFQKYLIDENGQLIDYLNPKEGPFSDKVIHWLEQKNK